jgi:NitT/TauT family transport system substrate-binding protein
MAYLGAFRTAAIALSAALLAATATAEPLKIRISYAGSTPGQFGPLLEGAASVPGLYKHYGQSYTVESVVLRGSGPALTALAADEVEIGAMSYETIGNAIFNAKLDVRIVADVLGTGMNGWGDDYFIVRKGEMKTIQDLKGKVAAVISHGSAPDTALKFYSAKHGLKHGVDYTVVEVGVPAMFPTLEAKRADLVFVTEPFTTMAEKSGKSEVLFSFSDALGPDQSVMWVMKAETIAKHRAALVDFMEDHIRLRHWVFDPKARADVDAFMAKTLKRPAQAVSYAFTKRDHWRDPNARPDMKLLQKNVNDAKTRGLLPDSFSVERYSNLTLIDEALKRIK